MGNDHECEVQGIGFVTIKLHDESEKTLTKVRYVPE